MAATGTGRRKQNARAKKPSPDFNPTFLEPDARWVRMQWPTLPENSSVKISLTAAGLNKYLQTPVIRPDLSLLRTAVELFDGNGIPFENHYVKIDPEAVAIVTGLPSSGEPIDMSVERRRSNHGGKAKVALEICGSDKAFGSKGIRVDLIKPVELKWAASVLTSRVFGQQKGEYLALCHFKLVKSVSQGHRFNWAEFVAIRIKEQLRKIKKDGRGCFYMGTVLSGLIYDQVPHLRPPEERLPVGGNPSLMKWVALAVKKECGSLRAAKQELAESSMKVDDENKKSVMQVNKNMLDNNALLPNLPNVTPLKVSSTQYTRSPPLPEIRGEGKSNIYVTGQVVRENTEDRIRQEMGKTSFRQLLQRQLPTAMPVSSGGLSAALDNGNMDVSLGVGSGILVNGDTAVSLDGDSERKQNLGSCNHPDKMSASVETLSGSPCDQESPKPKSSEDAEELDSAPRARKRALFDGEEGMSSKRAKCLGPRPPEVLLGIPLHQMTIGENVSLFKLVFDEVEKRLQTADQDCKWWKSCTRELCKDLKQCFAGLPMKESEWHDILNEDPMDSFEIQQSRAYIKKAAKIIEEQNRQIQFFQAIEDYAKKLECENAVLRRDLEMELQRRKVAEAQTVSIENQLHHIKEKLQRVFDD
eukprot:Gb_31310 [translate_table: standard]